MKTSWGEFLFSVPRATELGAFAICQHAKMKEVSKQRAMASRASRFRSCDRVHRLSSL